MTEPKGHVHRSRRKHRGTAGRSLPHDQPSSNGERGAAIEHDDLNDFVGLPELAITLPSNYCRWKSSRREDQ